MLSRYFYLGLNGQLCSEYFQKGTLVFFFFSFFWEASAPRMSLRSSPVRFQSVRFRSSKMKNIKICSSSKMKKCSSSNTKNKDVLIIEDETLTLIKMCSSSKMSRNHFGSSPMAQAPWLKPSHPFLPWLKPGHSPLPCFRPGHPSLPCFRPRHPFLRPRASHFPLMPRVIPTGFG